MRSYLIEPDLYFVYISSGLEYSSYFTLMLYFFSKEVMTSSSIYFPALRTVIVFLAFLVARSVSVHPPRTPMISVREATATAAFLLFSFFFSLGLSFWMSLKLMIRRRMNTVAKRIVERA